MAAISSESKPGAHQPELDAAQWRDVFGRLDALLDASPASRAAQIEQIASEADATVARVLKDFAQRTSMTHAAEPIGLAGVSQSLLSSTRLAAGQRCGQYRLIEPIGQGGMGSVWRADRIDGLYQSEVAVKLLGSLALSAHARARFASRARANY